mgnify:CR=1 FL=1
MITVFYHPFAGIEPTPGILIVLGADGADDQEACSQYNLGNVNNYYIDEPSFIDATILAVDSGLNTNALQGWYSDGTVVRYWNGSSFTANNLCVLGP